MSVHPIESRYGRDEVRRIFSKEYRLQKILDVEAALAKALAKAKIIPEDAAKEISKNANIERVKIERVDEIEREINHDVMAIVKALAEKCKFGGYVHIGATSNDITDTALALQLREFIKYFEEDLI